MLNAPSTYRLWLRLVVLMVVILGSGTQIAKACTPTQMDQTGSLTVWCCCDPNYKRCAVFITIQGAKNGDYVDEISPSEYC